MEIQEFKKIFGELSRRYGFKVMRHGWLQDSPECIVTTDLQKCPYSRLYYLNIQIFVQDVFGNHYSSNNEDLIKKGIGYFLRRCSPEYEAVFNLDTPIDNIERKQKLEDCFKNFLVPFVDKALTKKGLIELVDAGQLFMAEATKQRLC
jgi:hypothetical protein